MAAYKGHILGGIVSYALMTPLLPLFISDVHTNFFSHLFFLGVTLLGALFPDIDTHSTIRKIAYVVTPGLVVYALVFRHSYILIPLFVLWFGILLLNHRTLMHNLWFLGLITGVTCYAFFLKYPSHGTLIAISGGYFVAGLVSHLMLDGVFKRSFSKKRRY